MITIISSTKSLDLGREFEKSESTKPEFLKEVSHLVDILKGYNEEELAKLMKVSSKLAKVNYDRYKEFHHEKTLSNQAIFSFSGDVYKSMDPFDYSREQIEFAQEHLRILSGLYGVLRPLDLINEYRLEMATKLEGSEAKDLYDYWREKITDNILKEVNIHNEKIVLNLASLEYSKAIDRGKLNNITIYDVEFKENRQGQYKVVGTYAKRARGTMVSYIVKNRIDSIVGIKAFNEDGYSFNEELSTKTNIVFTR